MGLGDSDVVTVSGKGGEEYKFNGFSVRPLLARHNEPEMLAPEYNDATSRAFRIIMEGAGKARTPEQQANARQIIQGATDPQINEEGTIAYLFSFDDGFRLYFKDAGGLPTEHEREAAQRIGRADTLR